MNRAIAPEHKMAFAASVLDIVALRAPVVARPFQELFERIEKRPKASDIDQVYQDLIEWSHGLTAADRKILSKTLHKKTGYALDYFDKKRLSRLQKIMDRTAIRNEDEWRLVEGRVQEICDEAMHEPEIKRLNQLLSSYEKRKG